MEQNKEKFEIADEPKWQGREGLIPIKAMSDEYLQHAYIYARKKELYLFNRMSIFTQKIEELLAEADNRGVALKEHNTEFSKANRAYREKKKAEKSSQNVQ